MVMFWNTCLINFILTCTIFAVDCKENEIQVAVKLKSEEKKKEDDLWADFMKDTGFVSKNSSRSVSNSTTNKPHNSVNNKVHDSPAKFALQKMKEKVKIKQVFEFAGEKVEVEKEVPINSSEARLLSNDSIESVKSNKSKRSAGLSGIGNVLSQLTKKSKISTLEKTKLDWDRFKKEENLEEELSTHNKGKDG